MNIRTIIVQKVKSIALPTQSKIIILEMKKYH